MLSIDARQSVTRPVTGAYVPMTCGSRNCAAPQRVVAELVDAPAAGEEEAPQLRARVMEPPGGGPAVRAAEEAARPMLGAHARELAGDQAQRLVPAYLDQRLAAALRAVALRAVLEPALAHRRPRDPQVGVHHRGNRVEHGRRRRIPRERLAADDPISGDDRGEGAPVRERLEPLFVHHLTAASLANENAEKDNQADMDLGIAGRQALVMGASRGLGHACALALARERVAVTIVARNPERLARAAARIRDETGSGATPVAADFRTAAGRDVALAACPAPDILVTSAAGFPPGDFRDYSRDDWIAAVNDMMLGPIELMKRTVDGMIAQRFGRIVNIVSRSVKSPQGDLPLSNGARAGLIGFVAGLARQPCATT